MTIMRFARLFSIPALLAGCVFSLWGQTFSGISSGYVFDGAAQSVRALVGVPGAAYLGPGSASPWDRVWVAPNGKRAIGVTADAVNLIPDLGVSASFSQIAEGTLTTPSITPQITPLIRPGQISRVAWSADSTVAAIWSPGAAQLWRVTGLDSAAPVVHDPINLSALRDVLRGWSLSPDGQTVALAGAAAVYLTAGDSDPAMVGRVESPGAVAFTADGSSLVVLSATVRKILLLSLPSGGVAGSFDASVFEAAGRVAGTGMRHARGAGPVQQGVQDIAVSADGTRVYAVGGKTLCGYDFMTQQTAGCAALEITPESIDRMAGGLLMLNYTRAAGTPLWLLDGTTGRTYFVPAGNTTVNASF